MENARRLKILGDILGWDDEKAREEFAWLRMMASIKFDEYRDFLPGMRFFENLAAWLQQFETPEERAEAYRFLRRELIYVSSSEMQRLVELLYPCHIQRFLVERIAQKLNIPKYMVQVDPKARDEFRRLRRRTLVMGLSDGARIDILRHSTVGILSNEQFVLQTQVDRFKWADLRKDLRKEPDQDDDALFDVIYLVDDFMGSGSSFLRFEDGRWKGKLCKLLESLRDAEEKEGKIVSDEWMLCIHHYLAMTESAAGVLQKELDARACEKNGVVLDQASRYTFGALIDPAVRIVKDDPERKALLALTDKYYSTKVETKHTAVGGTAGIKLGYGDCGLPIVLHHNTPNNSLPLIWAAEDEGLHKGELQREVRALFRRRQRHTETQA